MTGLFLPTGDGMFKHGLVIATLVGWSSLGQAQSCPTRTASPNEIGVTYYTDMVVESFEYCEADENGDWPSMPNLNSEGVVEIYGNERTLVKRNVYELGCEN